MSYLNTQRIQFAGGFFSDPSTVNNDTAHYDNEAFDRSKHWLPQTQNEPNGWWNPEGANLFRLRRVMVTAAVAADGALLAAGGDPVLNLELISRDGRSAAKMVDLDPDQQLVSMIFGLRVALRNATGQILMEGDVDPAPFSDIWSRGRGRPTGPIISPDERASVFYQTVVQVSAWGDLSASPFLQQLRQAAGSLLSLKFQLDGYSMRSSNADRRFSGRIVGTLGAATVGEPRHWQPGRHLAGGSFPYPEFVASPGFGLDSRDLGGSQGPNVRVDANFGVAVVDRPRGKIRVDLGNALIADVKAGLPPNSPTADHGGLSLAVLLPDDSETEIAEIPYSTQAGWYERTAGIVEVPVGRALSAQELDLVESRPLAVLAVRPAQGGQPEQRRRLLQEPPTHVRAEMFVARLNPGDSVVLQFQATSLGRPLSGEKLRLQHLVLHEQFPTAGLSFPPEVVCDAEGKASVTLRASDPGPVRFFFADDDGDGNADRRVHVDGQVYRVTYSVGDQASWNPSDFLSVLVWNEFVPDAPPTWHGSLKPIFVQYGNLYPFMTTRGRGPDADPWLDLADYEQVADEDNRKNIIQVLELAQTDSHYMPVTRDLSRSKREAMLRWLKNLGPDNKPLLGTPPVPPPPGAHVAAAVAAAAPAAGKTASASMALDSKALAGERLMKVRQRIK